MLQQIRDRSRGLFGWILLAAIVFVLTLFGFGAFTAFVSSEPTVARVGKTDIKRGELEQGIDRQRRQMLATMGDDIDASLIEDEALADQVLASLVERTLLLEGARDAGMTVPEREIDRIIVGMDEFRTEGRFDPDRFRFVLASAGMTPSSFREALMADLLIEQLARGLGDSGFATEHEVDALARLTRQQRDVAWLRIDPADLQGQVSVDEADVRDHYERHLDRYYAEERVRVQYVMLEREALVDEVEVSEAALRGAYERELEAFEGQEQRRASHILVAVGPQRPAEDALELAAALRERIEAGEDFGELAREYSDDPGSAADGGDLGMAGRDTFVPEFERALFALEPGEVSEPVETQFGVHLIRLDEVAAADPPSFERRRPALLERLREEGARERFATQRQELDILAFEATDLEEPARELGLEIREAGPFTRDGGDGPFSHRDVLEAAFSRDVLEDGYNSSAIEFEDGRVLVLRLAEYEPARQRPFEEVADEVRADLVAREARMLAQEQAGGALERLHGGARTSAIAIEHGLEWERRDGLVRGVPDVPGAVQDTAFRLPHPPPDGRSVGSVELPDGSQVLVVVTSVREGDPAALTAAEREQLRAVLHNTRADQEFESYRQALRRDLGVEVRRREL